MKYKSLLLFLACIFSILLVACSTPSNENASDVSSDISQDINESENHQEVPPVDGVITEEVGSLSDYSGFWMAPDDNLGFYVLEIMSGGEVNCYDEDGNVIDTGFARYSEQDAITGLPLININLEILGDYASAGGNSQKTLHLVKDEYWVQGTDNDRDLTYFEVSPFAE